MAVACTATQRTTAYNTSIVVVSAVAGGLLAGPPGAGTGAGAAYLFTGNGDAQIEIEELKDELSDKKNDVKDKFSPLYCRLVMLETER